MTISHLAQRSPDVAIRYGPTLFILRTHAEYTYSHNRTLVITCNSVTSLLKLNLTWGENVKVTYE